MGEVVYFKAKTTKKNADSIRQWLENELKGEYTLILVKNSDILLEDSSLISIENIHGIEVSTVRNGQIIIPRGEIKVVGSLSRVE